MDATISFLASSKFMEEFFIQRFILVFSSCGQEDVTTDELMDHLAVAAQTAEGYCHILVKLYGYLELHSRFKIHVPEVIWPVCNNPKLHT